ncbi:hypothetical protein E8E14_006327 [Neopestalotiopsis sp. 37M]|nr:hypothetical protein E8E14_006327 [Neopestalotiopsis sp. 37M]
MCREIPDEGLASLTAADVVEDGSPAGAFTEATKLERHQEGTSVARQDQTSDSNKSDEDAKVIESNSNVDNKHPHVQPQTLDTVVATPSHPDRNQEASPYCPQIGQKHSILADFGHSSCPKCKQTLLTKTGLSDAPAGDSSADKGTIDQRRNVDNHSSQPDGAPEVANISYAVEYRDAGDHRITTEPWNGAFDLVSARKGAGDKKTSIFDVVTILKTTIRADSHRYSGETQKIMEDGILENPKIGVTVDGSKVVIHSPNIIKELASVTSYYPSIDFASETLEMREPYPLIAHHFDELEDLAAKSETTQLPTSDNNVEASQIDNTSGEDSETRKTDLRLLLEFMTSVYKDDITKERERHKNLSCTFRMLWLLFKPGETVYCQDKGQAAAYVVQDIKKSRQGPTDFRQGPSDSIGKEVYKIGLWNLDFDGRFVGRCARTVTITHFEGERGIKTLKAFPCQFIDEHDGGELRQKLECHGRVYVDTKSYYARDPEDPRDKAYPPRISNIEDMGEGLALCPCEECLGCRAHPPKGFRWSRYDVIDPWKTKDLESDGTDEPPRHRQQAKCIAEYTGKALLSLTSGDLGTDDQSVEKALNRWFTLAEAWGAVMLIDEADIYLERRQITDLKRNSLVSVFLRSIEYYRGILFLTTNRVGTFDDAFMSRIHVVIAYADLGNTERKTIWKQFFDKLTKDRQDITITRRAKAYVLDEFEMDKVNYNGREIRNAFQTAVALADYEAQNEGNGNEPVLDQPHFEHVLSLTADFKEYLKRIRGMDEPSRAYDARIRALPDDRKSSKGNSF